MILSLKILAKDMQTRRCCATITLTCDGQYRENQPLKYMQGSLNCNLYLRNGRPQRDRAWQSRQAYRWVLAPPKLGRQPH
jgi:hypothetical protein